MTELIRVNYGPGTQPTVSGRELHEALQITTPYRVWFPRMCEYGFAEGADFNAYKNVRVAREGDREITREVTDHELSIDMAKEICMLQRSDIGRKVRQYFLELERQWNTPEAVMARALQIADGRLKLAQEENTRLAETNAIQAQQIAEMQPKVSYYDLCLNCKDLMSMTQIAKDYGWSAKQMNEWLHRKKIQFKQRDTWLLYQKYARMGYTSTKMQTYSGYDGFVHAKPHTYWTQKGRLFIYQLMKADGNLPLIEKAG